MRFTLLIPLLSTLLLLAACGDHSQTWYQAPASALGSGAPGLDIADVALANNAPDTALHIARQALAANPRNAAALLREGRAEEAMGQREQAAASYDRALAITPNDAEAGLGLGRLLLATDPAAAEARFARIVARDPRQVSALTDLGIARDLQGHHAQAQGAYRQALAVEPGRTAAGVNLGLSLALSGDTAQALRILRPLAQAPGSTPRVRQNLAAALVLSGDTESASDLLRTDMPHEQVLAAIAGYQSLHTP